MISEKKYTFSYKFKKKKTSEISNVENNIENARHPFSRIAIAENIFLKLVQKL